MGRAVASTCAAALIGFGVLASSCGLTSSDGSDPRAGTASRPASAGKLIPVPHSAVRRCMALASRREGPVRCPTWLPEAKWRIRYATIESGSQAYLSDFRTSDPAEGLAFHVLAGGRTGPFSLRVTDGGEWPVKVPAAGRRCCYGGPRALS